MIVVTMELWPYGDESRKQHLGTARIWNDGTGDSTTGNYEATLSRRGQPDTIWKAGRLTGFLRKKGLAWDLLALVLIGMLGERPARYLRRIADAPRG